jgi:hypothetical protein
LEEFPARDVLDKILFNLHAEPHFTELLFKNFSLFVHFAISVILPDTAKKNIKIQNILNCKGGVGWMQGWGGLDARAGWVGIEEK